MKTMRNAEAATANHTRTILFCFVLGLLLFVKAAAMAQNMSAEDSPLNLDPGNLRTFIELARADIKTQKAYIIAQNMELTEPEAAEFWSLHREYEAELSKLNDRKLELIRRYIDVAQTMTDAQAKDAAKQSLDIEKKKTALKQKYFKKFSKVITARKAARFFQIENQLNAVLELQVAALLPLIK